MKHFIFKSENDCYSDLFVRIYSKLESEGRIIRDKVVKICPDNKIIELENSQVKYDNLVSTINANIFNKIIYGHRLDFDLSTKNKNFYVRKYTSEDEDLYVYYNYVYSINGLYTRKTFYNNYVVYESEEPKQELEDDCIYKVLNLPIQIVNSCNIIKHNGIHMLGRYAQWEHSIKFNEILKEIEERIIPNIREQK